MTHSALGNMAFLETVISLVPRPSCAPARKEGLATIQHLARHSDMAVRNVEWPITAQHSSIIRSLAIITRSTCWMLVVVDVVLYLGSTCIFQGGRSTQLLVNQCKNFSTVGRLRSKPALSESSNSCINHCLWEIRIECRYKTTSTTTSIQPFSAIFHVLAL